MLGAIPQLFNAISLVLLAWLVIGLTCMGVGLLIVQVLGLQKLLSHQLLPFWVGWAFSILVLQWWHLALPVGWPVFVLLAVAGLTGFLWNAKAVKVWLGSDLPAKLAGGLVLLVCAVWLADRALLPPPEGDAGLYHLATVHWAASYPIVPGLGNLHGRLAFNSAYFLYVAMLDIGPWAQRAHYLASGPLFLALFVPILSSAWALLDGRRKPPISQVFYVLAFPAVLRQASTAGLGILARTESPQTGAFLRCCGRSGLHACAARVCIGAHLQSPHTDQVWDMVTHRADGIGGGALSPAKKSPSKELAMFRTHWDSATTQLREHVFGEFGFVVFYHGGLQLNRGPFGGAE